MVNWQIITSWSDKGREAAILRSLNCETKQTCDSVKWILWSTSVAKSCSQNSIMRKTLSNPLPTAIPLNSTIFSCFKVRKRLISRMLLIGKPSFGFSMRRRFSANISLFLVSLARYTTPYVPFPIRSNFWIDSTLRHWPSCTIECNKMSMRSIKGRELTRWLLDRVNDERSENLNNSGLKAALALPWPDMKEKRYGFCCGRKTK